MYNTRLLTLNLNYYLTELQCGDLTKTINLTKPIFSCGKEKEILVLSRRDPPATS